MTKLGEYLIRTGRITREQLDEGLSKQKVNKNLLLGEILVSLGHIQGDHLFEYIKEFVDSEEMIPDHIRNWISQAEIDALMKQYNKKHP
jgi:hypothetical protein